MPNIAIQLSIYENFVKHRKRNSGKNSGHSLPSFRLFPIRPVKFWTPTVWFPIITDHRNSGHPLFKFRSWLDKNDFWNVLSRLLSARASPDACFPGCDQSVLKSFIFGSFESDKPGFILNPGNGENGGRQNRGCCHFQNPFNNLRFCRISPPPF